MTAIEILVSLIDEAFDHPAWHGPTLLGAVRGVTMAQAEWRPGRARHSIREITLHAAYWKYAVRRRLTGEKHGSFASGTGLCGPSSKRPVPGIAGSNWFEAHASRTWKDDVRLLVEEHRKLRAAVELLRPRALEKPVDAKRQTAAYTIRGIAAHDLYHAGQIQLLKKLQAGRR